MKNRYIYPFVCLVFIYLTLIYSNTFQVPFILDDSHNIAERSELHLSSLSIQNISKTFFVEKEKGKKLYRPISSLSLALNYFIGGVNVRGYHIVNLIIHLLSSLFLFKTILLLLQVRKKNLPADQIYMMAGFATVLWAASPIQIQAVTYIVQRMASLSAMFYILGLWMYIEMRIRLNQDKHRKIRYGILSAFFFLCAVLSKENAGIFPLGLLCLELFFFDGIKRIRANPLKSALIAFGMVVIPLLLFFHVTSVEELFERYSYRPFTAYQRLLTEPRILIFYLSQIFYPIPGRFSIVHSFSLSNSLFSPISTFLSIGGISLMLIVSFVNAKKYPLIGFAVVFYFVHHLVESTIIPLELVFEHRNYLPSVFLFLPIAYGFVKTLERYKIQNKILFYFISFSCALLIFFLGMSTYMRNMEWQTHESLWESAISNSPSLIRPYSQLGWAHTNKKKLNTDKAINYFIMGLDKKESYHIFQKALLWMEIGKTYKLENNIPACKKAILKSLEIMQNKIKNKPGLEHKLGIKNYLAGMNYFLANIHYYLRDTDQAIQYIERALELGEIPEYYNAKAKFFIRKSLYSDALPSLQELTKRGYADGNTYYYLGYSLTSLGYYERGLWFYKQAVQDGLYPPDINLYIADNLYLSGKPSAADDYLIKYVKSNPIKKIMQFITIYQNASYFEHLPFVNSEIIIARLKKESLAIINRVN